MKWKITIKIHMKAREKEKKERKINKNEWNKERKSGKRKNLFFSLLNGISNFVGYLMPNLSF